MAGPGREARVSSVDGVTITPDYLRGAAQEFHDLGAAAGDTPTITSLLSAAADEIDALRAIVKALAATYPEMSHGPAEGYMCGDWDWWHAHDIEDPATHADGCPWAAARRLMEETA